MSFRFEVDIFVYGKKCPKWLFTKLILPFFNNPNPKKSYREKVQCYAAEGKPLLEDLRQGLVLGVLDFVDDIRRPFLPGTPHKHFPQQRQPDRNFHTETFFTGISKTHQVDLGR